MRSKMVASVLIATSYLSLPLSPIWAAAGGTAPRETGAKASTPVTPGDAGKSGSAAGMTNGTGSRQGGAAGIGTHGQVGAEGGHPAPH